MRTYQLDDPCTCGHALDDHKGVAGPCLDDDCPCIAFDLETDDVSDSVSTDQSHKEPK